ncbi:MAG: MBL fold metallo-hydrolase [Clostridia bacterium]|nr:MBL fold metallo-hydrolase [Clostridia bacterium]
MAVEMITDRVGYIKSFEGVELGHLELFTNVGLIMSDSGVILIDTGWGEKQGRAILDETDRLGKKVAAIINTHAHLDHAGANKYIAERADCPIYCTLYESLFLRGTENMFHVVFSEMVLPLKSGLEDFGSLEKTEPFIVEADSTVVIDGVKLELVALPGHSDGHIGVICDSVFFTGDALLDPESMRRNKVMYITSPEAMGRSVRRIMATDFKRYVPAHGPAFENARLAGEYYFKMIDRLENSMKAAAHTPVHLDDLLTNVARDVHLHLENLAYYSTARIMVHSMANHFVLSGVFEYMFKDNTLYYKLKEGGAIEEPKA